MTDPAVRIERVSKTYGDVRALIDVSVEVPLGACVALVGESGSGKTTLLRCINRLVSFDAGRIAVFGTDVVRSEPVALRRAIGYVPQDGGLLPHWRVRRNVALVPWLDGAADASERADRAMSAVGLEPAMADRWPHELSGGQQQRAAVARAVAGGQSLVLLDEPFGALDAIARSDLQGMLIGLRKNTALTLVLVTHDLHEAFRLATSVVVMRAGRVEQHAPPADIRGAPATPYVTALLARAGVEGA
ncbi:MAG TPA: ATP-binding cassette domain-containing protein [Gemmatimonadaceae bacterium]|nr:ATP-binding cassette domain-containing protein [Gemmatimonadaceae bacterium]